MRKYLTTGKTMRRAVTGLLLLALLAWSAPSQALDKVRISAFQGSFVALPLYVAKEYKLFEKHGLEAELIYGTGIQVTNILVGRSADYGAFAIEHGINLLGKGQDLKLLVVCQSLTPYGLIVRNEVPTPNIDKPYPEMLKDLKGLKLGVSTLGAGTDTMLRYLLDQVGIKPSEVQILPVGATGAQVAGLKNGTIDGAMSFEPAQSEAVQELKIAKMVLDLQGGQGPEIFRDFAYNGLWTTGAYLKGTSPGARPGRRDRGGAGDDQRPGTDRENPQGREDDNMRGIPRTCCAATSRNIGGFFAQSGRRRRSSMSRPICKAPGFLRTRFRTTTSSRPKSCRKSSTRPRHARSEQHDERRKSLGRHAALAVDDLAEIETAPDTFRQRVMIARIALCAARSRYGKAPCRAG